MQKKLNFSNHCEIHMGDRKFVIDSECVVYDVYIIKNVPNTKQEKPRKTFF